MNSGREDAWGRTPPYGGRWEFEQADGMHSIRYLDYFGALPQTSQFSSLHLSELFWRLYGNGRQLSRWLGIGSHETVGGAEGGVTGAEPLEKQRLQLCFFAWPRGWPSPRVGRPFGDASSRVSGRGVKIGH